jgi:hypothetical protein
MRCVQVTEPDNGQVTVKLQAHYDTGGNEGWSKWTPWGEVVMGITNPDAHQQFEMGKVYFIDFTLAE